MPNWFSKLTVRHNLAIRIKVHYPECLATYRKACNYRFVKQTINL